MRNENFWLLFLATISAAGCGGEVSGGGSACGATAGCGGDVVGTWHATALCADLDPGAVDPSSVPPACLSSYQAAVASVTFRPEGYTIVFRTDGTYQVSGSVTSTFVWALGSTCMEELGRPLSASSCADLSSSLASGSATGACVFATSYCRCTLTETQAVTDAGTYRTEGTTLYMDVNDPAVSSGPYCVQGTSMSTSQDARSGTAHMEFSR